MGARLAGKVAIITGAGSGIGAACARAYVQEGARVLATDVDAAAVRRLAAELGDAAYALPHDVTVEAAWRDAVTTAESRFGAVHVLVNNAGIGRARSLVDMSLDEWRVLMAVNLDGVFLGMKHAIPAMARAGIGSIVNVSSIDGILGAPLRTAYCASKGGVLALTKAVAMECCELGHPVRVNSVHPGPTATNIFAAALPHSDPAMVDAMGGAEGVAAYYLRNTPMTRFALPEEIAHAVVYLGSDEAAFVTGSALVVDGGFSAGKLIHQRLPAGT